MPFHKTLSGYSLMYRPVKVRNTSFRVGFLLYQLVITHIDSPLFGSRPNVGYQEKSLSVMYKTPCNLKSLAHYTRIFLDLIILSFCQSYYFYYPSYPIFSKVSHHTVRNEVLDFHIPEHIITAWSLKYIPMLSSYFCLLLYDTITIHKSNTRDRLKQSCKYMKNRSLTSAV